MPRWTHTHDDDLGTTRTNTDPANLASDFSNLADGTGASETSDGMRTTTRAKPDPRFGMQKPIVDTTIATPGASTEPPRSMQVVRSRQVTQSLSGGLLSQTDTTTVNGNASTQVWDAATRTMTTTSPEGRQMVTTQDEKGHVLTLQVADLAPISYHYDSRGRLDTVTEGTGADARTTTAAYDGKDRLATVTDPLMRMQNFAYDEAGRIVTETLTDGSTVGFGYDPNGNMTSLTPPGKPEHSFTYTPVDLEQSYGPPALMSVPSPQTTYEYNLDQQPIRAVKPDGTESTFAYDSAGRLASTKYSVEAGNAAAGTIAVTNTYSPTTGNLASMSTSDGEGLAFAYDGSLLLSVTSSGSAAGVVSATYDNNFRPITETVAGDVISLGYDRDGLTTNLGALSMTRDPANGLVIGTALASVTDTISRDVFGQPSDLETKYGATTLFREEIAQRDRVGRIVEKVETIEGVSTTYQYSYNSAGRLWQVMTDGRLTATYLYDANGNRTSCATSSGIEDAASDDQDRLLANGIFKYTYAANGELQTKTNTSTGETTRYTYDGAGALRRVVLPDGRLIEYAVDPFGRRIQKSIDGFVAKKWLYGADPLQPTAELDGNGALVSRFVGQAYLVRGGATYRLVKDHSGSVRMVVDASTGTVAQRLDFESSGRVTRDTSPGFQPFGYAGGIYDPDTGLVRFGARDYDPVAGRWTTKDPLRFRSGQSNLYAYVGGDPINGRDVSGLCGETAQCLATGASVADVAEQIASTVGAAASGTARMSPSQLASRVFGEEEFAAQSIAEQGRMLNESMEMIRGAGKIATCASIAKPLLKWGGPLLAYGGAGLEVYNGLAHDDNRELGWGIATAAVVTVGLLVSAPLGIALIATWEASKIVFREDL